MTRVPLTTTSMRLPHAVVSSQPANTTDFIDDGAFTVTLTRLFVYAAALLKKELPRR